MKERRTSSYDNSLRLALFDLSDKIVYALFRAEVIINFHERDTHGFVPFSKRINIKSVCNV
jgi:hypothetical protein